MKRSSSAYKIAYDIRPAKQTERRIILDILKICSRSDLRDLHNYQYIGFGGFKFYDFEMLFRHLGISDMVSIEGDKTLIPRCEFNRPFNFIVLKSAWLGDYLNKSSFKKPILAWLDYDTAPSGTVVDDIITIGAKAPAGSFLFVTIDARIPQGQKTMTTSKRAAQAREEFQDFSLNPTPFELEASRYHFYAERVIWAALTAALSSSSETQFVPLMRVFYEDTALMATVGACKCDRSTAENLQRQIRHEFPFLLPRTKRSVPYQIPPFNFTPREWFLLDVAVTASKPVKKSMQFLKKIGLSKSVVEDYKRVVRFVPRYFETYI